jgi:hypothetical protein
MSLGSKCRESKCRRGANVHGEQMSREQMSGEQVSREQMSGEQVSWIRALSIHNVYKANLLKRKHRRVIFVGEQIRAPNKMRKSHPLRQILPSTERKVMR